MLNKNVLKNTIIYTCRGTCEEYSTRIINAEIMMTKNINIYGNAADISDSDDEE